MNNHRGHREKNRMLCASLASLLSVSSVVKNLKIWLILLSFSLAASPPNPAPPVYSFDIFDTLIGRLHFHPDSIFEQVEKKSSFPNFVFLRKSAERLSNGTLSDIYQKLKVLAQLDDREVTKLMQWELETEMEQIFPIAENLALVKSSDILISDTYYNRSQIRELLDIVGCNKDVQIHVSAAGKSSGGLWEKAKRENWGIALHTGDNLQSDVKMALRHNIPAKHYTNSQLSYLEQRAVQMGDPELGYLMRALRLQNPYLPSSVEHAIWNEQTQINIPILIECSLYLDEFCKAHKKNRILFSSRDCCLWKPLFEVMFPQYESIYFHTSRHVYLHPSPSYVEYVRSVYTKESAIVDGQGSGDSCMQFFKSSLETEPTYLAIVNVDLLQFRTASEEILKVPRYGIVKTSEGYTNQIEKINVDLVGTIEDFREGNPVRLKPEYDLKFVLPAHECIKKCLALLPHYSFKKWNRDLLFFFLRHLETEVVMPRYVAHVDNHFPE